MTEKQAQRALAALDSLIAREQLYREIARADDQVYQWEREALFRLRGFLIAAAGDK